MNRVDPLDARLLLALDDDPDATVLSLSRSLGVARNTVHARLRRLAADGTLKGFSRR
ncbi:MAG: Lrp/AsnC family transcriptional regulator, partial [Glaciihabitans sp.]|nr:Lrp/AsnC family transcriptional regulator [Glaciihabitans sp.]